MVSPVTDRSHATGGLASLQGLRGRRGRPSQHRWSEQRVRLCPLFPQNADLMTALEGGSPSALRHPGRSLFLLGHSLLSLFRLPWVESGGDSGRSADGSGCGRVCPSHFDGAALHSLFWGQCSEIGDLLPTRGVQLQVTVRRPWPAVSRFPVTVMLGRLRPRAWPHCASRVWNCPLCSVWGAPGAGTRGHSGCLEGSSYLLGCLTMGAFISHWFCPFVFQWCCEL